MDYSKADLKKLSPVDVINKDKNSYQLDLAGYQLKSLPREIRNLSKLNILLLNNNNFSEFPEEILELKNLKGIDLGNNKIEELPCQLANLKNLRWINLNNNNLQKIPEGLSELKKLLRFDIGTNFLSSLPIDFGELINLVNLNLSYNKFIRLPVELSKLINLQMLDIRRNHLSELPEWLFIFDKLYRSDFDRSAFMTLKTSLFFQGNPIKDPPIEVLSQGRASVKEYFRRKSEQGLDYLQEAKIVVVGAGAAGKTTLVKKLQNPQYDVPNEEDKRTEGIAVCEYPFKGIINGVEKKVTAHVWDFGGQEIYHTTHQFFLSEDTLYLLVNDNRQNNTDFYYWLNVLALRAGDQCPVLVIFNEKDNAIRRITLSEEHFDAFPGLIKTPVDVNFSDKKTGRLQVMIDAIHERFLSLEALGKALPKFWVDVRHELRQLNSDYISFDDFYLICQRNGIQDEQQARIVSQTLHNIGVLLHFQKELGLDQLLVLNPNWCLDAVYRALDAQIVKDNHGKFKEEHLVSIWSESKYKGKQSELLKLMRKFDLCYEVHSGGGFIAPQLLPTEEKRDPNFATKELLRYRYEYKFMPKGLITRFIAKMSKYIKEPFVWYGGVTLQWGETIAEVTENPILGEINIRIYGPEKKRRLLEVQDMLIEIQQSFRGLKIAEKIPCNCERCINSNDPFLFDVQELIDLLEVEYPAMCHKQKPIKPIKIQQLLSGVFDDISTVITDIKQLISNGETARAIDQLNRLRELREDAIVFSNRLATAENSYRKGTISNDEYQKFLNRINESLINLLHAKKWNAV